MSKYSGKKADTAQLKNIANDYGLDEILDAVLELEWLRNKVGQQRNIIKKKQHVIDTVAHHNNRLSNDNQATKYALGAKFMEVVELTKKLEELTNGEN